MNEKNKKRIVLALWIIGVILIIAMITGPYGLYQRVVIAAQKHQLEKQIDELNREQALLKKDLEQIKWNLNTIEKTAREKYGFVRKNERVYQFIPRSPQPAETPR